MSDVNSPRPRLVSVDGEPTEKPPEEASPEATPGAGRGGGIWLLAVLLVAAVVGLVVQQSRVQALQGEKDALAGELFTARSALDAYGARFAEVRESVEGLQSQLVQLDRLVNADPLEAAPAPQPEPVTDLSD